MAYTEVRVDADARDLRVWVDDFRETPEAADALLARTDGRPGIFAMVLSVVFCCVALCCCLFLIIVRFCQGVTFVNKPNADSPK
jgi:hypothetical protein